jgi:aquaporin Z
MTLFRTNRHNTAQQERMVQKQASPDFLDPLHEWRRLFAETWGTFLLVLVAAGGGVVAAKSGGALPADPVWHRRCACGPGFPRRRRFDADR